MKTSQRRKQVGAGWVARQSDQIVPDQEKKWTIGNGVSVSKIQYLPGSTRVEGMADGRPFVIDL